MESAQEKLDQMLRAGKITDDDYLQLSKAMEQNPDLRDQADSDLISKIDSLRSTAGSRKLPWQVW